MENELTFITGGARSGKTSYAQKQVLSLSGKPVYIATAKPCPNDGEFSARVQRHIADREHTWVNIEEQFYISKLELSGKVVLIDCVTLWLTNFFSLYHNDIDKTLQAIKDEIDATKRIKGKFFMVSNEIGMGIHASTELGRRFTDLQGWTNQYIASKANNVILMVSGIPLKIK